MRSHHSPPDGVLPLAKSDKSSYTEKDAGRSNQPQNIEVWPDQVQWEPLEWEWVSIDDLKWEPLEWDVTDLTDSTQKTATRTKHLPAIIEPGRHPAESNESSSE